MLDWHQGLSLVLLYQIIWALFIQRARFRRVDVLKRFMMSILKRIKNKMQAGVLMSINLNLLAILRISHYRDEENSDWEESLEICGTLSSWFLHEFTQVSLWLISSRYVSIDYTVYPWCEDCFFECPLIAESLSASIKTFIQTSKQLEDDGEQTLLLEFWPDTSTCNVLLIIHIQNFRDLPESNLVWWSRFSSSSKI